MKTETRVWTLDELILANKVKLGRGNIISKKDIASFPGEYPIYSSAREKNGTFGFYGKYMFDEELITWSIDGGGRLFYRPRHKFSVTNVGGTLRILDTDFLDCRYMHLVLTHLHSKIRFDWVYKAHPSVIRMVYNEIPIPSLEKQREIVEKLDSTFVDIDLLEKNLDQNSEYILEIEASLVANLWVKYADKLTVKRLEEVADYKNGSAHEKIVDESGDFVIVNSKFISSNGLKFKRSSKQLAPLKIGDVTMVLSDVPNGKALAKCFLVDKDDTYTLNQRICKLTSEDLLPEFLALNVNRNPYLLSFNNGENQTNLRLNDVLKTPIYVADKETQKLITDEFVEAKKTILGYSKLNMRKAESLKILKQSLLISNFSNLESDVA